MKAHDIFAVNGSVAVVTGAAGGLGYAYAEVMADNGALVVMVDVDGDALPAAAERLRERGATVEAARADITDHAAIRRIVDAAAATHGRVDVLFANAGISAGPGFAVSADGSIENITEAAWERVLGINLTGTVFTVQAAAAHMKRQRSGRIVITSSAAGFRAESSVGYAYVASKAAIANFTRQTALELAPYNVTVNAIAPGRFTTNIAKKWVRDDAFHEQMAQRIPLGRYAAPQEIAGLALLLASPASSYITGTIISIDGGTTAGD